MAPASSTPSLSEADEFVNIWVGPSEDGLPPTDAQKTSKDFYGQWIDKASASMSIPPVTGADALRRLYPNHSLVLTQGYGTSILGFPGAQTTPLEKIPLVTNLVFIPLARSLGSVPGILIDQVQFGAFNMTWQQYEFIVYVVTYPSGLSYSNQYFILHEGPEEITRLFLLTSGKWTNSLHEEIWVYNQGYWQKDHGLWVEVQKADWKDVILKDDFKKALQKDVYGFFASESIYKELAIPWKRGLIMYGPPGNGKTISLKTIMKTCGEKGFAPLYVKSFQSWMGEEGAMADVFNKARQLAPCVVVLEDLDSLINDSNRSFFLNQLDGIEGNDGLLIIGTTNHFDRLDPGLSTRPSRFDRKYKFDDPDQLERKLYAQYWQNKLASNKEIDFSDQLVDEVVQLTDRFSFAYLKEAFVSSLVTFAGIEGEKPSFGSVLKGQIETLRKQLDKSFSGSNATCTAHQPEHQPYEYAYRGARRQPPHPNSTNERDVRALLDALSESAPRRSSRVYQGMSVSDTEPCNKRDIRVLLDALSDSLASLDLPSVRAYDIAPTFNTRREDTQTDDEGRNFRTLLDRISSQGDRDIIADRLYHSQIAPAGSGTERHWRGADPSSGVGNSISPLTPQFQAFRAGPQMNSAPQFGADLA